MKSFIQDRTANCSDMQVSMSLKERDCLAVDTQTLQAIRPERLVMKKPTFSHSEPTSGLQRKVSFESTTAVISIPSHREYTYEDKSKLWTGLGEIAEMAARNMLEFAAEGWDWRNVAEDEDLLLVGGEAVHPIHTNPLLKAALSRHIQYPRALSIPEEKEFEQGDDRGDDSLANPTVWGAVCALQAPIERPSCPCPEELYDSDDDDEHYEMSRMPNTIFEEDYTQPIGLYDPTHKIPLFRCH